MLESSGFADEIAAFDAGMAAGDPEQAKAGLSDRMLAELAGIGDKAEVHAAVRRYQDAGVTSPCIGGLPGPTSTPPRGRRRAHLSASLELCRSAATGAAASVRRLPERGLRPSWRAISVES